MPLSRDELDREYRAALRRELQLLHENEALHDLVLHLKGRLMTYVQHVDFCLADLKRTEERHAVANDVNRMEVAR